MLRLIEQLDDALAAVDLGLRRRIELRAELREGGQLAKLRQVAFQPSSDLLHRLELRGRPDAGDRDPDRDRRTDALIEQIRFQEDLAVGDRDDVGRNVRRHVAGLRFDDRQRRQRTVAELLADAGGAFEQPAVEVEDVARIRFAAGRPLQHERHLPVGHGMLGEIVVDDQGVHAVVHEPFAHRRAGKRREILARRGIGGRRRDDDRVGHGARLFEHGDEAGDRGLLLADGDVDAVERAVVLVARAPRPRGSGAPG